MMSNRVAGALMDESITSTNFRLDIKRWRTNVNLNNELLTSCSPCAKNWLAPLAITHERQPSSQPACSAAVVTALHEDPWRRTAPAAVCEPTTYHRLHVTRHRL
ncbi:uncharacterized protein LOC131693801 isoform X1 [Topomyia yanbarensis]|uniref:uncharacterized protein LOC131693801 isoform X1 n=1 Tax=Topomyia yanbarensis TaxID=2498891 RepID=UPI00273B5389|nr:uncharacterized protein LOC131693801 isoform X1 [Topomyia yanbarensis]